MDIQGSLDSLQNLDPDNIGSWPLFVKIAAWLLAMVICGVGVYTIQLSNSLTSLEKQKAEQDELLEAFEAKAFQSANLDKLKKQLEDMEASFGALVRQLPSDTEVPGLLDDISQVGIDSGLVLDDIGMGNEKIVEFYAELPIQIEVSGAFHALGGFVSGVAMLPRIVTLHDLAINPTSSGMLRMSITAKTYRYNDKEAG